MDKEAVPFLNAQATDKPKDRFLLNLRALPPLINNEIERLTRAFLVGNTK
ncbi:MAG: hypothetical protein JAZ17_08120 [Candidatus Thiodiazotropha endolucinida]|nr:hypothetical protein [Candidatus Thiodiazotropha endolucinida]